MRSTSNGDSLSLKRDHFPREKYFLVFLAIETQELIIRCFVSKTNTNGTDLHKPSNYSAWVSASEKDCKTLAVPRNISNMIMLQKKIENTLLGYFCVSGGGRTSATDSSLFAILLTQSHSLLNPADSHLEGAVLGSYSFECNPTSLYIVLSISLNLDISDYVPRIPYVRYAPVSTST
jgi:hypothetical protein